MLVAELAGAVMPILIKGVAADDVDKCVELIEACGKKISGKLSAYMEKRKAAGGNKRDDVLSPDLQQEITAMTKEALKGVSKPVYLDGIMFFLEIPMDKEVQGLLEEILTNIDYETEDIVWEDEEKAAYQKIVDDFIEKNYGSAPDINEQDYLIEEDSFYLNFGFSRPEDYYRTINDLEIRSFADALNQLLGDKYIVTYTAY